MRKRLIRKTPRFPAGLWALAAVVSFALAATAAGQEAGDTMDEAPGVRVTDSGNRVIYSARYFLPYNVVTARDMLERIPGTQGLLGGGGGRRGFGNSGDQVLIDGKRLSGKFNSIGSTVGRIQARQVERIEVIRGTVEGLDVRSRGRVVNLVLNETLVTGFGSWEGSWSHYSDGRGAPGAEVNYSGHAGALDYVLSAEADGRRRRNSGTDLFYTPDNALFERQVELDVEESYDYAFTANTGYSFGNGDILNINALYSLEDESESRLSSRFDVEETSESFARDIRIAGEDERRDWELGADYEHVLPNGNTLTALFLATSSRGNDRSSLELTPAGEERDVDELRFTGRRISERIVRGTYEWGITDTRSFESGVELAVNTVETSIRLLENIAGTLEEISLFNQASEVEETRVEAFTTYTRQLTQNLLIESSLDLEASKLSQEGADVRRSRDFFFARPRLAVRYDLSDQTQLRAGIERSVNQLDFGAFTASFTNDDNRLDVISAGNPELVPEKSWDYELTYERRLPEDAGLVSISGTLRDVENKEARIPLLLRDADGNFVERTAPGNIGDGHHFSIEVNASIRLGWLNLERAVLEGSIELTDTRVTDPFTGETRDFDWTSPYEWQLSFRHDTSWRNLSYGLETGRDGAREQFDLDYRQVGQQEPDLEMFVEMQPLGQLTVRLELEEALRSQSQRERFQYFGNRGEDSLQRREVQTSRPLRELTLSVRGIF